MRFRLPLSGDRRITLERSGKDFVVRLAELQGGRWTFTTPPVRITAAELREYDNATRSPGAFVREWRLYEILLKWEWQTLIVVHAGEVFGEGDRSTWEAAVRRFLLND